MADTTTTTETWLYAGKGVDAKGKLFDRWHDGHRILSFGKLSGSVPGHGYAVEVIRDGDHVRVQGSPRYLAEQSERTATEIQLTEWRADDRAAKAIVEGRRVEKAAAQNDELEQALEVIRVHYDRLRTAEKRGAFISHVMGEMQRKPKPATKEEW